MAYPDPETVIRDWLRANVFTTTGDGRVRVEAGPVLLLARTGHTEVESGA